MRFAYVLVDFRSLSGSHDGGGALQRNFLPFIAQHIFFGIFFLLIYFFVFGFFCLLGGFGSF